MSVTLSILFFLLFHFAIGPQRCMNSFLLDRKIDSQNTFYTNRINIIIDSIDPSIILMSIVCVCEQQRLWRDCADAQARLSLAACRYD